MAGNRRYDAKEMTSFAEDLEIVRQNTIAKREPFAAVLSCADSRVLVQVVFDQAIGHVFVTRVAGNICTPDIITNPEYGPVVLGTGVTTRKCVLRTIDRITADWLVRHLKRSRFVLMKKSPGTAPTTGAT
jgi:hypothetical protein